MRALWSGLVNFGLVNIPIKIQTAVKTDTYSMHYLRKDDMCPIQYKKVCRRDGQEVPLGDIVRGYEYEKGDYVVLKEEDFQKAAVKKTYTIAIELFVNEREVDFKYIEKPYFLEPEKRSHAAYALFRSALQESGMVGIGRFVLKDREHLALLKADHEVIMLIVMRFASTLKKTSGLDLPKNADIPRNQKELALELINKHKGHFRPEQFKDNYIEQLKRIIETKKHGKTIHVEKETPQETAASDILEKLKKSLAAK
ncbi:MAG: Ku protein [Elusimicrobia bacterium]|nr:Ku protein [Candidatus Liberimonas magnetica]